MFRLRWLHNDLNGSPSRKDRRRLAARNRNPVRLFLEQLESRLTPSAPTLSTLAYFNALGPTASPVMDSSGNLYGTTGSGGASNAGTVYELAKGSSTITTLASFNGTNGSDPQSTLIMDSSGNLYGTPPYGGLAGEGTIFELQMGLVITSQPSSQSVTTGANVTFTASANGYPTPTVQWQVSTDGGTTFQDLSGQISTTLTLNAVAAALSGNEYRAVFTNVSGTATTNAATLTVTPIDTFLVNAVGDSGTGSGTSGDIRYCITQADLAANSGSTITFASGLSGQTISLANGQLAISDNVTITGLGPTSLTISGGGLSRVFDITSKTAQVTISSLTISGGSISGVGSVGGGVLSQGSLTLSDCDLTGNTAYGEGGGIYNAGSLTISNSSTLSNNSANYGGAVFTVSGNTLTVQGSTLSGNVASQVGGGIYNAGSVFVSDSSTLSNNSAQYGGGIFTVSSGTLSVTSSTLSGNSASVSGGGIWNYGSLTIDGGTLSKNTAVSYGGGIYNAGGGTVKVSNASTLSGNSAHYGGAVFNVGSLTINGSPLSGNSVSGEGGGIYIASGGNVTLSNNAALSSNKALYGGGAFTASSDTLTVTSSTVAVNSAGQGGGVYNRGTLTVSASTLSSNSASYQGGGVYNSGFYARSTLTLSGSTLSANTASDDGGGIYNNEGTVLVIGNTTIGGSNTATGVGNIAGASGGGIYSTGGTDYQGSVAGGEVTVSKSSVTANTATTHGGGVYYTTNNHGSLTLIGNYNISGNSPDQTYLG